MTTQTVTEITPQDLAELLLEIGWKALIIDTDKGARISSAINGVNFDIRFVSRPVGARGWTDITLSAPFAVDRSISPSLGANWNRGHRFARVYRTETHVFLDMDVSLAGGVARTHLKYQLALWADITNAFLRHLRNDSASLAKASAAKASASAGAVKTGSNQNPPGKTEGAVAPSPGAAAQRRKQTA